MSSLDDIRAERLKKLKILVSEGIIPYPLASNINITCKEVFSEWNELVKKEKEIIVGGRVMAIRAHGGSLFLDISDGTEKLQVYLKKNEVGEHPYSLFVDTIDIGDFVAFSGTPFLTKKEEKTISAKTYRVLAKSLRPLPDKWHGLQDIEERFRHRYLDVLMSGDVRERFLSRTKIIKEIRTILDRAEYLEVETPMLQNLAGGATARPFVTHHNALDMDFYMRIAPELFLKKLLIAGFPKVYELGRSFRNEGIDMTHNPEFTTLEAYAGYSTPKLEMKFIEKLIKDVAKKIFGGLIFSYSDKTIDLTPPFQIVTFASLLKQHASINETDLDDRKVLLEKGAQYGIEIKEYEGNEKILDSIYKKKLRPFLITPTFVIDYPALFSPLAKRKEEKPWLIDRFQLIIGGLEIANGFAELNDPLEQKERFTEQDKKRREGDLEAQGMDEEFVHALEYGMPPATGWGMGVDRFVMLMTNAKNIREVILFPTLRPKS